jgi:S-adenosylmethionine synthetase
VVVSFKLSFIEMEEKVLITGASGLLGRAVLQEFANDGAWDVLGLAFSRAGSTLRKVDITDSTAVHQVVQDFKVNHRIKFYL